MEFTELQPGLSGTAEELVTERNTAAAMGSGSLPVYATPAMTCLMEQAAAELAEANLPEGWTSVGISLQIQHKAATPVGCRIRATAKITAVEGRKLIYEVQAFDNKEEIGSGTHERFLVQKEKFLAKAKSKQ